MAYASFSDVVARAGRFAGGLTVAGKHPDQADVEKMLADVAGEIDAAIIAAGFALTGLNDTVKAALVDLNAAGALARALPATNPGPAAADVIADAAKTFQDGILAIINRSLPAIAALEGGLGGELGPGGGSFFDDPLEPDPFDLTADSPIAGFSWWRGAPRSSWPWWWNRGPTVRKGQSL